MPMISSGNNFWCFRGYSKTPEVWNKLRGFFQMDRYCFRYNKRTIKNIDRNSTLKWFLAKQGFSQFYLRKTKAVIILKRTLYTPIYWLFSKMIFLTAWNVSKYVVISGLYFPVFSPNRGKYGPEITTYLNNFHAARTLSLNFVLRIWWPNLMII